MKKVANYIWFHTDWFAATVCSTLKAPAVQHETFDTAETFGSQTFNAEREI